jgi:hypothetical protein
MIPITDMPLELDTTSISEKASLNSEGVPPVTVQDPSDRGPLHVAAPILQAILFLVAFCVHYFRVHHILLFGVSLEGWAILPECVVFCIMIGVLAVQQIG